MNVVYQGGQLEPLVGRLADEKLDELRKVYGNAYCEQRKAGTGGAEAERFAMSEVLRKADNALEESELVRERMTDLLNRVAVALRGPEPEGTAWSWHDLPERAAAAIAAIGVMEAAARAAARQHAEDADWPECSGNPRDCPENEGHGCCNVVERLAIRAESFEQRWRYEATAAARAEASLHSLPDLLAAIDELFNANDADALPDDLDAWGASQNRLLTALRLLRKARARFDFKPPNAGAKARAARTSPLSE